MSSEVDVSLEADRIRYAVMNMRKLPMPGERQSKISSPEHPSHIDWLTSRRERFVKIIRTGKRTLKLNSDERELCTQLADLIQKRNKELTDK